MILPATETRTLHAKPTQAVDILAFVEAEEISSCYFENRYYLAPAPGDENGYAMLLETLRRTHQVGIAYVVLQARQHLAAVIAQEQALILHTLRWASEDEAESNLSEDDELLAACWLAHQPQRKFPLAASRQDHRWQHRDGFHADLTQLNEQATIGEISAASYSGGTSAADDEGSGEIDDAYMELLHQRAHRKHVQGIRRPPAPHYLKGMALPARSRRR